MLHPESTERWGQGLGPTVIRKRGGCQLGRGIRNTTGDDFPDLPYLKKVPGSCSRSNPAHPETCLKPDRVFHSIQAVGVYLVCVCWCLLWARLFPKTQTLPSRSLSSSCEYVGDDLTVCGGKDAVNWLSWELSNTHYLSGFFFKARD